MFLCTGPDPSDLAINRVGSQWSGMRRGHNAVCEHTALHPAVSNRATDLNGRSNPVTFAYVNRLSVRGQAFAGPTPVGVADIGEVWRRWRRSPPLNRAAGPRFSAALFWRKPGANISTKDAIHAPVSAFSPGQPARAGRPAGAVIQLRQSDLVDEEMTAAPISRWPGTTRSPWPCWTNCRPPGRATQRKVRIP
jgi:hypothetical protein